MTEEMCMNLWEYWMYITSFFTCKLPCRECRKIYNADFCPKDIEISDEKCHDFVKAVTSLLKERMEIAELPWINTISEEEFMNILSEAYNEQ